VTRAPYKHYTSLQHPCLQVRFAKNNQFVQASEGPSDNRQLFFSGAPRSLGEGELVSLFSSWGSVEEVNLFRDRKTGASKGSGFVTMATREQAANVLHLLGSTSHQVGG
jgi:RNA recognition motif-containing protein